jgi:hypothetical protein
LAIDFRRAFLNFLLPAPTLRAGEIRKPDAFNTHNLRYWDQTQQLTVSNTAQAATRHSDQDEIAYERN